MKLSLNWIKDYAALPADLSAKDLAHQLTMSTVEVEGVQETDGDVILEIDNKSLTNRPDLWGHYGMARELAAIYKVDLKPLPRDLPRNSAEGSTHSLIDAVGITHSGVCRRFTATRIENIAVLETPEWIKRRLVAVGQRSKNLYADLTNYVMLATGQPMHAFDAAKLSLPLSVRPATADEPFDALDGTHLTLSSSDSVVADANGAVGLAGIIGGLNSAIQNDTTSVILEVASFDPLAIRRTSAAYGVRTEASTRFEKSVSTLRIDDALGLFFSILRTIDPGARATAFQDVVVNQTTSSVINANADYLRDRIGARLSISDLSMPLKRLGFVVDAHGDDLTVTVPEWRSTGDVSGAHDLVEEIARMHGYEHFDFQAPHVRLDKSARSYSLGTERRVKEYLAFGCGLQEVINYPWTEDRFIAAAGLSVEAAPLRLSAPPAPDQATLRTSLVPGLLRAIESNIRWQSTFSIFEAGTVFASAERARLTDSDDARERLPKQTKRIAAAFVGDDAETLFRRAKGVIENLAQRAHVAPLATAPAHSAPWADSAAAVAIVSGGRTIGELGVLGRRGTRAAGLKHAFAVVFEFDLDGLISSPSRDNKYSALPELPSVSVDVSLTYPDAVLWEEIAGAANGVSDLISAIEFIDQYRGKGIPDGHRSITLRAVLQPTTQTLTSEEAVVVANAIRAIEKERHAAIER